MTATMTTIITDTDTEWVAAGADLFEVQAALNRLSETADRGQRSRRLGGDDAILTATVYAEPFGSQEWGGEGVPNSYRQMATTSVAGVAWFTAPSGEHYVRVVAKRVIARKSPYGLERVTLFGDCHPAVAVFPALAAPQKLLKKHQTGPKAERWPAEKIGMVWAIAANPFDKAAWAGLADFYADHGEPVLSARCQEALTVVRMVAAS